MGRTSKRPAEFADSFWARLEPNGDCREWSGSRDAKGYGMVRHAGQLDRAHRVAWRLAKGEDIPDGWYVCHTCDNPPCCNPLHLFLGTALANAQDARKKRASRGGSRGHISPHGTGKWRLFVNVGVDPVTGRRRQVTKVVAGSRKEAERALAALLVESDGGHHAGPDLTLGELLDKFLEHKALNVEQTTVDTWTRSARYVTDRYRAMPIRKVDVAHLEALYDHLLLRGRKRVPKTGPDAGRTSLDPQTVRNVHVVLYGAFELARRRKWIPVNPAADAEAPKVPLREPTPADPSKLPALFVAAEEIYPLLLPTFIRASLAAGTRRSEMHGLRWSGVDFAGGRVTIRDVIVRAGGEWVVKPRTKTGRSRTLYLDGGTMELLTRVYDRAFANALAFEVDLPPDAFVFTDDPQGREPWKPATTARRFSRCCAAVGLPPRTRIHDLRTLCGTHLADQGLPVPVIGARLGHTRNSTTADIYVGRIPDSDRLAAEAMGRLLDGGP